MSTFLQGVGAACAIFSTGLLLALGWGLGVRAATWIWGPTSTTTNYNVNVREPQGGTNGAP